MDLKQLTIGLEFGSTRIKAVVINSQHEIICQSDYLWENQYLNGVWTYGMDKIVEGMQSTFRDLLKNFEEKFGEKLTTVGAMGISGMMHGYLVFDKEGNLLAPFRTWRNTMTEKASDILTEELGFAVPQRWSCSHVFQAVMDNLPEVTKIDFATTLAGYVHYRLTGERVVGIGEGSGMFPIDSSTMEFNKDMLAKYNKLIEGKVPWKLEEIFPRNLVAGVNAGYLTEEGAKFLDPSGTFQPGVPMVPPEGDMGTGMVCTNSCRIGTGNASIGTSSNVTIITGKNLPPRKTVDIIASPSGAQAALIHVNNGTSDINVWVNLFAEAIELGGGNVSKGELYVRLFNKALEGAPDCGGLLGYNTSSGEPVLGINEARPLFLRTPNSVMSLANFMRVVCCNIFAPIRKGLDILAQDGVRVSKITGHGGYFKTPVVGARIFSSSVNAEIVTLRSAGEGGPYGTALLAAYYLFKEENETLEDYLDNKVFKGASSSIEMASPAEIEGFEKFYSRYLASLPVEIEAINTLKVE